MFLDGGCMLRVVFACIVFFSGGGTRSDPAGATRAAEVRRQAQDAGAAHRRVLPAPEEQHQGANHFISFLR